MNGEESICTLIRRLTDMVSDLENQVPRWISVKDRLPPKNKNVLVYVPVYPGHSIGGMFNGELCEIVYFGQRNPITHWMTLPDHPLEENI